MKIMNNQAGHSFAKLLLPISREEREAGEKRKLVHPIMGDDLSLFQSSTHTAVESSKGDRTNVSLFQKVSPFLRNICRRRVHFDEGKNLYYDAPPSPVKTLHKETGLSTSPQEETMCLDRDCDSDSNSDCDNDDLHQRWYTSKDYQNMKEEHKKFCRKLHRNVVQSLDNPDDHVSAIINAYHACDQGCLPPSVWLTLGMIASEATQGLLPQQQETALLERTGLELVIIHAGISRGLKQRRRQLIVELAVHLCTPQNFPSLTSLQLAEILQERCEQITRPARLFACALGHANACSEYP